MRKFVIRSFIALAVNAVAVAADWPQWGGPARNFRLPGPALTWPPEGPPILWERPLGDGYSAIVTDGSTLYTMFRRGEQEVVIALDAATGKTIWVHPYQAPVPKQFVLEQGAGPRSTPLIAGDRLISVGSTGIVRCVARRTGELAWSHDLAREYGAVVRARGYSPSPLLWRDTVILIAGGADTSVMSVKVGDGSVVWKTGGAEISYASPILIRLDGQEQVVALLADRVIGMDPAGGGMLWSHAHANSQQVNASQPVWGDDGILFISSAYDGGCRALQLSRRDGATQVKELWSHRLMRVHFSNVVRLGDVVYGSSGDMGPTPFTAVNVKTGALLWRDRGLALASFVEEGGRFLALDEEGVLVLAEPGQSGLKILGRQALLSRVAWTPPTVDGERVYVRDREKIVAVRLAR